MSKTLLIVHHTPSRTVSPADMLEAAIPLPLRESKHRQRDQAPQPARKI